MSVTVQITVEDVAALLDAGYSEIQLERATSVGGSYSNVTDIALVSGTFYYSYEDSAGTLASWYRYRFSDGVSLNSSYTNPFQVEGVNRLRIRQAALEAYDAGMVFTAGSGGDADTVVTTDYKIKSTVFPSSRGKGGWLYCFSGANIGEVRRIEDATPSSGSFEVDPAFSNAVQSGDGFEWHWLADPAAWDRAINRGMPRYWWLDRVPIVGVDGAYEYSLAALTWLRNRDKVTGLWHYPLASSTGDDGNDEAWAGAGRWWQVRQDGGALTLCIRPPIAATKTLYLEALRPMPALYTDDSVAPANCDLDLAAALAYDEVLAVLSRPGTGASQDREAWKAERIRHASQELRDLLRDHTPKPRYGPPQLPEPPHVPAPFRAR